jgi:hypothetical protein
MNADLYWSACAFAGRWLAAAQPWSEPIGRQMTTTAVQGVYIVCNWAGDVLYVGSTICGVKARVISHLRNVDRTLMWTTVWVVPLLDVTPPQTVRRIEGLIGRALRPVQTLALPAV